MKKAQTSIMNVIGFGILLLLVLGVALIVGISVASLKPALDTAIPQLQSLPGTTGTYMARGLEPISTLSDNLGWIVGGLYIVALVGILGIAYGYRLSGQRILIVLFFGISILVILASILVSNIYQGMYNSGGTFGSELQAMTLFSWLMLYSPLVMIIITFFGGAIIFSGLGEEVNLA